MYVCTYVCMYICICVCVCLYVCTYACMYIYVHIYIYIFANLASEASYTDRGICIFLGHTVIRFFNRCVCVCD
jgi:hypothetical protein